MNFINQLIALKKDLKTYSTGLLQTRAYRVLKVNTDKFLKPFKMTSAEWAYLGVLYENKDGMKANELAKILGVEAPFITSLSAKYQKRDLVGTKKNLTDSRAKCIFLTDAGRNLVEEIEPQLRSESKKWLEGVTIAEILTYIKVLKKIANNKSSSRT